MSNEVTRTAAHVAADINKVKLNLAVAVVVSSIEIGRLLLEAKALVPHGEWGAWLAANVDFSESKAQSLMRRYKEYGDGQIDMITGTSDLDFFAFLSDSQMDALLALPKPERREFVEEHREEIESGEMSVRDMKAEIAKLRDENEQRGRLIKEQQEQIDQADEVYNGMFERAKQLHDELETLKNAPAPEPMVQETIVYQPSPEKIEEIRAEEAKRLNEEHAAHVESVSSVYRARIADLEKERNEALDKAKASGKSVKDLVSEKEKIEADHKAAMDKLKADHAQKLTEMEASFKKQAKASAAGTDANVTRILIAFENIQREVTAVQSALSAMESEDPNKAAKYKANVEATLGRILEKVGWTV